MSDLDYKKSTVLITGGAGAIGSNLAVALSSCCSKVIVMDNFLSSYRKGETVIKDTHPIKVVQGDIRNEDDLRYIFSMRPDVVFHLATFFANQNSIDYPNIACDIDLAGLLKVLSYCNMTSVKRFVFASSSCVYGEVPDLQYTEHSINLDYTTPYQANKMTGEIYTKINSLKSGLPSTICRFFNSYGPGEPPGRYRNVIPNFVHRAIKNEPLTITGTGEETRDFTYVDDICDGLMLCGSSATASGEVFNLGNGVETNIKKLAETIIQSTGSSSKIIYGPKRPWDHSLRRCADISKARRILGYNPTVSLEKGLEKTIAWFKNDY